MFSPSNSSSNQNNLSAAQRRQASARQPQMQITSDNRTASNSATRQQQSGSNLHMMPRPTVSNPKKMKLIRTRATGSSQVTSNDKKRLKSPNHGQKAAGGSGGQGRNQSLNLGTSASFLNSTGGSVPKTTKNTPSYRQSQPMQDQFLFSATSPPVQINKQAILMNSSHVSQGANGGYAPTSGGYLRPSSGVIGKQPKESLGHITASRRQKQAGLQINVDNVQSIVINNNSIAQSNVRGGGAGHLIASPQAKPQGVNAPDNLLFYGASHIGSNTMSPQSHHHHGAGRIGGGTSSLNQEFSPKTKGSHGHGMKPASTHQVRRQTSSMSKKQLRQTMPMNVDSTGVTTMTRESSMTGAGGNAPQTHKIKHQQSLHLTAGHSKMGQSNVQSLTSYQVSPKGGATGAPMGSHQMDNITGPRSTKARSSQHFVKGRFIETQRKPAEAAKTSGPRSPSTQNQQQNISTLDQQQRAEAAIAADEATQILFMLGPTKQASNNSRLMSPKGPPPPHTSKPTTSSSRPIHSSYNSRTKNQNRTAAQPGANSSSLGFKQGGSNSNPAAPNQSTLKIQNMRHYNETSTAATTTAISQQRYAAMRNNFIASASSSGAAVALSPDRKDNQHLSRHNGSKLRHFHNQSSSSNMMMSPSQPTSQASGQPKPLATKKRKLTLNQRTNNKHIQQTQAPVGVESGNQSFLSHVGSAGASLAGPGQISVAGQQSMRPLSGAVKSYSMRASGTGNVQGSRTNSQRQSKQIASRGSAAKNIQILSTDSVVSTQLTAAQKQFKLSNAPQNVASGARVYSPNAAMNGRRDINAELQNLAVPQFYPSTTTNQNAPRQFQFTTGQSNQTAPLKAVKAHPQDALLNRGGLNQLSSDFLTNEPDLESEGPASTAIAPTASQNVSQQHTFNKSKLSEVNVEPQLQSEPKLAPIMHTHTDGVTSSLPQVVHGQQQQSSQPYGSGRRGSKQLKEQIDAVQGVGFQGAIGKDQKTTQESARRESRQKSRQSALLRANSNNPNETINSAGSGAADGAPNSTTCATNKVADSQHQVTLGSHQTAPLVIPNFTVNLPQTTTAASAPKGCLMMTNSSQQSQQQTSQGGNQMLIDLAPISKNSHDINAKLAQRKVESARRPTEVSQESNQTKTAQNLQVVVTHELNPVVNLAGAGYKQMPQTTTNATKSIVPSLSFSQQNQASLQASKQGSHQIASSDQHTSLPASNTTSIPQTHRNHATTSARQNTTTSQPQQSTRTAGNQRQSSHASGSGVPTQRSHQTNNEPTQAVKSSHATKRQNSTTTAKSNSQKVQSSPPTTQPLSKRNPGSSSNRQPARSNKDLPNSHSMYNQQVKFPMTPAKCLKLFGSKHLTDYEKTEILDFPQVYYFGEGVKKIQAQKPPAEKSQDRRESSKNRAGASHEEEDTNCGYDDSKGNYRVVMKDHIAFRYEMVEHLGRGSFGVAVKCFDHKTQEYVAVKIIKNKKKYYYQAGVELKILQFLKDNDPDDTMNIIHMKDYVIFRKHLCITFELMSINLYEFLKLNDFEGLSLSLVRRFAIQLLYSLKFLKENDVIHCDLKPENILLKDPSKSGIKIIDFGSSCFQDERVYTYIQSRFYRAPEIILGIPYTPCIDMWSFGCIMAEFAMGYPIFPGEDETDQISLIMEVCGIPAPEVLSKGQRKTKFFNESNMPKLVPNSHGKVRKPGTKVLDDVLECSDQSFVNFVERCLEWDPEKRMSPDEAIRHQWILEGLPPKVLVHHQKLHNIPTKSLPEHIREQRAEYLATQPLDVQMEFRDDDEEDPDMDETATLDHHGSGSHAGRHGSRHHKSKSLDRTSGNQQSSAGGRNVVVKQGRYGANQTQSTPGQSSNRNRQAQSFDTGASGYRHHQGTSANQNAQTHHSSSNRHKKGNQQAKPSVEQMLHASQQRGQQ